MATREIELNNNLSPDKKEMVKFFSLLNVKPNDPVDVVFIDRVDKANNGGTRLRKPLKDIFQDIHHFNNYKCLDTSLVVNVSDGQGIRQDNIIDIRAFYIDIDNKALPKFLLEPTMIYSRDSTHWYAYWVIKKNSSGEIDNKAFYYLQSLLIHHYEADPEVKRSNKALRIPGTLYWKNKKEEKGYFLHSESKKHYTYQELLDAHDKIPELIKDKLLTESDLDAKVKTIQKVQGDLKKEERVAITNEYVFLLSSLDGAVEGAHGDHTTFVTACRGKDLGVKEEDCLECLLKHWNPKCSPPWSEEELRVIVGNAYRYGSNDAGSSRVENRLLFPDTEDSDWINLLKRNKSGEILKDQNNIYLALKHGLNLKGVIRLDLFLMEAVFVKDTSWRKKGEYNPFVDVLSIRNILRESGCYTENTRWIEDAVMEIAIENAFDPLVEYVDKLKWDGVNRIDEWLIYYGGARDNAYHREVGAKTLIAGIARALAPGCKVDTMLILEGLEGGGKSSAVELLGRSWFASVKVNMGNKDFLNVMRGKWVLEIAELSSFRNSDWETLKGFLTRKVDRDRLAFDKKAVDMPRRTLFIGTTNRQDYLSDESGARRFWPVEVNSFLGKIDELEKNIDQLWAEAKDRYLKGEKWHLSGSISMDFHKKQHDSRIPTEAIEELIVSYFEGKKENNTIPEEITHEDIFINVLLRRDYSLVTHKEKIQVNNILKNLGWVSAAHINGRNKRSFIRKEKLQEYESN